MAGVRPRWSDWVWVRVFLARVRVAASGCWEWTGPTGGGGYGRAHRNGRHQYAHRVYYEFDRGPVPDGLTLDHLCRNRLCVNPDHLEPVSIGENVRRGVGITAVNAAKTACERGHPFDEANTKSIPGGRECRACKRAASEARPWPTRRERALATGGA